MKAIALAALALPLLAAPVMAQSPPAQLGASNVPAPLVDEPVIASIGNVRAQIAANRAQFAASFSVVDRTQEEASRKAIARVQEVSRLLSSYGPGKVQIETTLTTRPLYEQYRTKEGQVLENQRADKIDNYEVTANLTVRARDLAVIEPVMAAVLAAKPSSISQVAFTLDASNDVLTRLQAEAIKDAVRRARLAVDAAGARLGVVRLIDPTARACQTDVLAGWPSYVGVQSGAKDVSDQMDGEPAPPPPPAAAPMGAPDGRGNAIAAQSLQLTLQPPLRELSDTACVVFSITG